MNGPSHPSSSVVDTLKRAQPDGLLQQGPDRSHLVRAQTPQAFSFGAILKAHRSLQSSDETDDAAVAEKAGVSVVTVSGEEENFKVTTADDLRRAENLATGFREFRTGLGYDVHAFSEGDFVTLCGVRIPHDRSLQGHSDADVGLHALTDALLGCIAAGDIGQHFPPSDPRWQGADSAEFLRHAAGLVTQAGGQVRHADITLICERPKIGPYRDAMRARIAELLDLDPGGVNIKATTTEGLGFTGRREGCRSGRRDRRLHMNAIALLIATYFGIGRLPGPSGTWGSLAALPPAALLVWLGGSWLLAAALLAVALLGWWASEVYGRESGVTDASEIVVDEVAGQWIPLLILPFDPAAWATAFVAFRFFDIVKPWPSATLTARSVAVWASWRMIFLLGLYAAMLVGGLWIILE